jgi:hypothetical protein
LNEVKGIAGDRNAWKLFMDALSPQGVKGTDDDENSGNFLTNRNLLAFQEKFCSLD